MPRDPGGLYFLPAGNPVITGTIIESDWANPTMSDIGQELSDSLSRSGKGGMLAALRGLDGSAAVPTFSFTNEPATGRYRAGPGQIVESVDGTPVVRYLATGLEQWDSGIMDWVPLTPRDAAGTPFNPAPSNLTSTNVQAAIEEVNSKTGGTLDAANVLYDDSAVYFPAATVQQAIDRLGADFAGLANDVLDNADAILVLDGELQLLTNRVTLNETNIGNNTTDIALLDTRVTNHDTDIGNNQQDISSIKLEQITQNSDINQLQSDVTFVYNITQTNANNISQNVNDINQNESDIVLLDQRLDAYDSVFPGGVLQVPYGGTGVTSDTGSGSLVLNNAPSIISAILSGTTTATTPATGEDSVRVATTAYVKNQGYFRILAGSNSNGVYLWFPDWAIIMQWGSKAGTGSIGGTFPTPFGSNPHMFVQQLIDGYNAPWGTAPVVSSISNSNYTIQTDHFFNWFCIGIK